MKKYLKRFWIVMLLLSLLTQLFLGKGSITFAQKLKLNCSSVTIQKGKKCKLKINKVVKKVKWKSSNKKIVTVNSKGVIQGKKIGKTKVTATVGKKKLKCVVNVVKKKTVKRSTSTKRATETPARTDVVKETERTIETENITRTVEPVENKEPLTEHTPASSMMPQVTNMANVLTTLEPSNSIVSQIPEGVYNTTAPLVTSVPLMEQKECDYGTLESLKNSTRIKEGDIVTTGGYYEYDDGGAASYLIVKDDTLEATGGNVVTLLYGLKAKLIMDENTVSVKQFGAKGDGKHDDTQAINEAFNSEVQNIIVPKGEYKVTNYLKLGQSNVSVAGEEGSIIFTDNDYREYDNQRQWLLYIEKVENINISGITLEARQTKRVGYSVQFGIRYASDININGCKFIIPETVLDDEKSDIKRSCAYFNSLLFTGWHNILIQNCEFIQMSDTNIGGCIGFHDIDKQNCDTAIFQNNLCKYKGHDEMISIFSTPTTTIKNITIHNNELYAYPSDWSVARTMCFSIGYDDSLEVSNVSLLYNKINACSDYAFMTFGNSKDVLIAYNTISFSNITKGTEPYLFKSRVAALEDNICIKNNDITVDSSNNSTIGGVMVGNMKFQSNIVDYNIRSYTLFVYAELVEDNVINLKKGAEVISSGTKIIKNNKLYVNGSVKRFLFQLYSGELNSNIEITGNQIEYEPEETAGIFLLVNPLNMKGYEIIIENNKIISNSTFVNPILCLLSINDTDKQKIKIKNNSMMGFEKIIYTSSIRTDHIIEYEDTN